MSWFTRTVILYEAIVAILTGYLAVLAIRAGLYAASAGLACVSTLAIVLVCMIVRRDCED